MRFWNLMGLQWKELEKLQELIDKKRAELESR